MNGTEAGRLYGCPVEFALKRLGGKWKTVIMARLKQEPMRYGELRSAIPELSEKVLTQRLAELRETGLVQFAADEKESRYELTERGASLGPVLQALYDWGLSNGPTAGVRFRSNS